MAKIGSEVRIVRAEYEDIPAGQLLKDIDCVIGKGERVLLKVNLLSASEPEKAVTTHPAVVAVVAKAVMDIGAEPYIGDSPGGRFTKRSLERAYERSGLFAVARDMGIELNYDTSTTTVDIPNGRRLKRTKVCNFALKADKIIALPKLKTHSLMVMTLATKIMYGIVPGLTKARYHSRFPRRKDFADMLLDVLSIRSPDLFVMDAIIAMEGNGPGNGSPLHLGLMLASREGVAMDIAVCEILGIEPVIVPTLRQANLRGMWPEEIHYPLLSPVEVRYEGFKLPGTVRWMGKSKSTKKRVPVPTDACVGCGRCQEICPKGAIKVDRSGKAKVDYSLCIRCYCCHEVCPYNAIKLKGHAYADNP